MEDFILIEYGGNGLFLAHLSRRLIGELIVYPCSGVRHRGLQPIIVCSNNDPGVTLTYFTARSNLGT